MPEKVLSRSFGIEIMWDAYWNRGNFYVDDFTIKKDKIEEIHKISMYQLKGWTALIKLLSSKLLVY